MADLTVTLTESVTLNGSARGSTNTLTVSGVDDIYHRIITVPSGASNTTLVAFTTAQTGRDGAVDRDLVKYIRITNLDGSNSAILNLQIRVDEDAASVGDANAGILLEAGKSFMLGGSKEMIDVAAGANDIDALTDLHDLESIMIDPLAAEVRFELFIASVV
tara:strand:+ start:123 stop:608 length:486 start_codon:yes stop_codon:yes gene_type:complete